MLALRRRPAKQHEPPPSTPWPGITSHASIQDTPQTSQSTLCRQVKCYLTVKKVKRFAHCSTRTPCSLETNSRHILAYTCQHCARMRSEAGPLRAAGPASANTSWVHPSGQIWPLGCTHDVLAEAGPAALRGPASDRMRAQCWQV